MPRTIDKYLLPRELKKSVKYSEKEYAYVKELYDSGYPIRQIAKKTPMSRRNIQLFLFPERKAHAKKLFQIRQKEGKYRYSREVQSQMNEAVRNRKKKLFKKLIKK